MSISEQDLTHRGINADGGLLQEGYPKEVEGLPGWQLDLWNGEDIPRISEIEAANWAPWLRTPPEVFHRMMQVFPEGHILLRDDEGTVRATLTTNRTNLLDEYATTGDPAALPTWDAVADVTGAGNAVHVGDYSGTYDPNGAYIIYMSMNGDTRKRKEGGKKGLAFKLLGEVKSLAQRLETGVASPFRPTHYGEHKKLAYQKNLIPLSGGVVGLDEEQYRRDIDFANYCSIKREDGQLQDPWLRIVTRDGHMNLVGVCLDSMAINVGLEEFAQYQQEFNPTQWFQVKKSGDREEWECGQTGTWYVDRTNNTAQYIEPNCWGIMHPDEVKSNP